MVARESLSEKITIRAEAEADRGAVREVLTQAFDSPLEADLVAALRPVAEPQVSLVAELDGQVVGHIFFSPVTIESDQASFEAMGLGPMAVVPGLQRRGIGSALVSHGLEECERLGHYVVVVVGHADYYPRFGFRRASEKGLRSEFAVPDEVFMVAELRPGALGGRSGLVKYRPEFKNV